MAGPAAGTRLGRYRLVEPLGSGAFATVWRAHDESLDLAVAVKVLADNWSLNSEVRDRFLAEARILRRVTSPRVVRVHDIGEHEQRPFFVMDLVAGGTLDQLDASVPPTERLRLAAEVAYAIHDLHEAGVAHRDVKPGNLLLDRTSELTRVLVTDLGTAKLLADASGITVTTGTPAYMAPEQVYGAGGIDARADVYAVGVVAYELLSGRRPFVVPDLVSLTVRGEHAPDPIAEHLGLPSAVDTVLRAALSRDRGRRPADARTLGELLTRAEQGGETALPSLTPGWSAWTVVWLCILACSAAAAATWLFLA